MGNIKKIRIYSEAAYLFALMMLSFSVAMSAAADFGVSMIVAPSYILSLKFKFLTFGQWDYAVQGIIFIVFCIIIKKIKPLYLVSFATCMLYSTILDFWRIVIPVFNPSVVEAGSMDMPIRVTYFVISIIMCAMAVAMLFRVYIYPQVCDFFVVGISKRFELNETKIKRFYDFASLTLSLIFTLVLFGEIRGIGVGTVIITIVNGTVVGFFGRVYDKCFEIVPAFPRVAKEFEL